MRLVEWLELAGALAVIVGLAWITALFAPASMAWSTGLIVFGVLVLLFSWLIDRRKG